jgi:hypothetical protein
VSRWEPVVAVSLVVALLWGIGASLLVDALGWSPLVASVSTVVVVAAFGWTRRGRDILDVVLPAFAVSYAAYIGLALVRASHSDLFATHWRIVPVRSHVPEILLGGVAIALILTICVAIPISMIPGRTRIEGRSHERFWTFVREQNAMRARTPPPKRASEKN